MTQQESTAIRDDVRQGCFSLLDAHAAAFEEEARKHSLPRALFVQWLVRQYLRSAAEDEQHERA